MCDASSTSFSGVFPAWTDGLERHELEAASDKLKDRLLRSESQPAGTERANEIIVKKVMRCVVTESQHVPTTSEQAAIDTYESAGPPDPSRVGLRPEAH